MDDHWERLPASWREPLEALSPEALAELLMEPPSQLPTVWPLSLLAFLAAVHALRLPGQLRSRAGPDIAAPDETERSSVVKDGAVGTDVSGLDADDPLMKVGDGVGKGKGKKGKRKGAKAVGALDVIHGRCAEEAKVGTDLRRAVSCMHALRAAWGR